MQSIHSQSEAFITSIVVRLVHGILVALCIAIPLTYYAIAAKHQAGSTESEARMNANLMAELLTGDQEAFYRQDERIWRLVHEDVMDHSHDDRELRRIFNGRGELVHPKADPRALEWPSIAARAPVLIHGVPIAYFEVERSLSDQFETALGVFAAIVAFSLLISVLLQRLVFSKLSSSEESIARKAKLDALTGLPNRESVFEELQRRLSDKNNKQIAVFFIDLDQFKAINDNFGHNVGDAVIVTASREIRKSLRAEDYIARLAGDEFIVVVDLPRNLEAIKRICDSILDMFSAPYLCAGHEIAIGVTIGVAVAPHQGRSAEELIQKADMAMYAAKARGRGTWAMYEQGMAAKLDRELQIRSNLRQALNRNEFVLHYQPIFDLETQAITGAEALLRWKDSKRDVLIYPNEFIAELESSNLIVPVGEWVLRAACKKRAQWSSMPANFYVSVNISSRQLFDPQFVEKVKNILAEEKVPAGGLMLELTESMVLSEEKAKNQLRQLRNLGLRLAIDDFGVGFSSLHRLAELPFDTLKIDRAFIQNVNSNDRNLGMVISVLTIAHSLRMGVIAEGIEEDEQQQVLIDAGCSNGQGYLFAKPMPEDLFERSYVDALSLEVANL